MQANKTRNLLLKYPLLIFRDIFDYIAPNVCIACGDKKSPISDSHKFLCNKCLYSLPYSTSHENLYNGLITKFGKDKVYLNRINALLDISNDDKFLELIHSFKYKGLYESAETFGEMLGKKLLSDGFNDYDAIVPLPIHHARKRERGYNQSEYIAVGIAKVLGIKVNTKLVKRSKYTLSQTKLNAVGRRLNLADAFKATSEAAGKRLLIVDDVMTTGSTLNYCAEALHLQGAATIDGAAIAAR